MAGNKKRYGIGYQGSKNKVAEWVVSNLPSATRLYDLFAGGCAITHCAMMQGKYKEIVCNDVTDSAIFFYDALDGKYNDRVNQWVSRADFERLKSIDPCIRICWSFGHDQKSYLFAKEKEPYMKALWDMAHATSPTQILSLYMKVLKEKAKVESLNPFGGVNSYRLECLERLRGLSNLQDKDFIYTSYPQAKCMEIQSKNNGSSTRMYALCGDYKDIKILPDSIIYCDIPYKGKKKYDKKNFDYEDFYAWCERQTELVIISEYEMPTDRFVCISSKETLTTMCATNNSKKALEKLFIPVSQLPLFKSLTDQ